MRRSDVGQASVLLVGVLLALVVAVLVLGGVARGVGAQAEQQRAADLAALAGARAMHAAYGRLFEGPPRHLSVADYRRLAERAARATAARNGAHAAAIAFPDAKSFAPVRIRVDTRATERIAGEPVTATARAEAELAPPATLTFGDEYSGPLETRQGKPMRPDVARAFDRLDAAARAAAMAALAAAEWTGMGAYLPRVEVSPH